MKSSRPGGPNKNIEGGVSFFGENSNLNFEVASGNTIFLSSPTSDDNMVSSEGRELKQAKTVQHVTPVINQKKLLSSHRNIMKDNV